MNRFSQLPSHLIIPSSPEQLAQAQRLFHGRGHGYDGLKHITVDWLPPVALITLFAPEAIADIEIFSNWLQLQLPSCKSIQLQHRYQLSGPIDVIYGETIQQLSILENNLQFHIRLGKVRNTGLFLDMKNGRQWLQQHSKNQRVLNLFSYTCGFSVAAIAGQAKSVLRLDMSSAALNVGRENHRLNQQSLDHVRFEKLNILKSFSRLKKRGAFDLLICDPPTFQKGSIEITKDYPKILRHLDDFMAQNSTLLLCLNAPELSRDFLIDHMATLAPDYKLIEEIKPPTVYVETEGKGLKVLCFKKF
ncbi:MAG: class I SAM-dependent methyltransferase [Methylococcales bacterium]|nr:class I SAM-dependent methyltransferase [Methylococcales bacterium]